jgi:hypothetical protein
MPILFEYTCPDCGSSIRWIYDEEEERLRTDSLTGCPGGGCTKLHEANARHVQEDEAAEFVEGGSI